MAKNTFDLAIIIVTYNSEFWLEKTLHSLNQWYLQKTKRRVAVIVVDNNSVDSTEAMVAKQFPWVQFQKLQENTGFAAANNRGISMVAAKYYLLLNSDIELSEHSNLDTLINFAAKRKDVGVISPRLVFSDGRTDMACHRGEPTLWASLSYFLGLEKFFPQSPTFAQYHQTYKDMDTIHTIDACSGAALLVKQTALKQVGPLDERFFMYAEDLDWCKRFRDAGFLIVYHPGVVLIHHKYKSGLKNASQKIAKQTKRHFFDTMLQYYDKHYIDTYPRIFRWFVKVFIVVRKGAV
ncbi:glycosyltransferase family 2 protein [Candidatus Woesebacteria bacterium]|nr:glycosyltransferase family 2 protein [Candidatus Woesebacteria bacterium]